MTTTKKNKTKKASVSVNTTEIVTTSDGTTVEVLQMKPSVDILDMKLTRSELIDLVTEEVESDLRTQLREANKQVENINKEINAYFKNMSDDELMNNLIKDIGKTVQKHRKNNPDYTCCDRDGTVSFGYVYLTVKIPGEYLEKKNQLSKTVEDLKQKIQKLSSKSGKLEIMKQMLATSEEGQKLLAQIQGFKKSASVKLLGV